MFYFDAELMYDEGTLTLNSFFLSRSGPWWRSWSLHSENVEVAHLWNRGQEDRVGEISQTTEWRTTFFHIV